MHATLNLPAQRRQKKKCFIASLKNEHVFESIQIESEIRVKSKWKIIKNTNKITVLSTQCKNCLF